MKILLVNPYLPYPYGKGEYTYNRVWPPLCLANCAAILEKEGHKVKIMDAHAQRIKPEKIVNYGRGYDKIFITSSPLDRWQCPNRDIGHFLETVRQARKLTAEVYVLGYHGTINAEQMLNLTGAKAVIRGEPEETVRELCKESSYAQVKGIAFKDNDRFILNPERQLMDLKTLPIPAYHLLDLKRYSYELLGENFALFEISRGCCYQCGFCNKIMYGKGVRFKSLAQITQELAMAIERYKVKTAYFIDLEFLSGYEIVEGLCKFLREKRYNFTWCCQARPSSLNIEILRKMKDAGCRLIHLGIESGLQKSLDYLGKNLTLPQISQAVKLCQEAGIKTLGFFLFGLPHETDKDREEIFGFSRRLNNDYVSFHRVVYYKATDICQQEFSRDKNIDRFIRRALMKYYLRPVYLLKLRPYVLFKGLSLFWGRLKTL